MSLPVKVVTSTSDDPEFPICLQPVLPARSLWGGWQEGRVIAERKEQAWGWMADHGEKSLHGGRDNTCQKGAQPSHVRILVVLQSPFPHLSHRKNINILMFIIKHSALHIGVQLLEE